MAEALSKFVANKEVRSIGYLKSIPQYGGRSPSPPPGGPRGPMVVIYRSSVAWWWCSQHFGDVVPPHQMISPCQSRMFSAGVPALLRLGRKWLFGMKYDDADFVMPMSRSRLGSAGRSLRASCRGASERARR